MGDFKWCEHLNSITLYAAGKRGSVKLCPMPSCCGITIVHDLDFDWSVDDEDKTAIIEELRGLLTNSEWLDEDPVYTSWFSKRTMTDDWATVGQFLKGLLLRKKLIFADADWDYRESDGGYNLLEMSGRGGRKFKQIGKWEENPNSGNVISLFEWNNPDAEGHV